MSFEFGGYRLDPSRRQLTAPGGQPLVLKGRAFDILLYLVRHAGELQSKDDLMAAVWPGLVVEENNLNQAISAVRRALNDTGRPRRFVTTVSGHGYQFVARVQALGPGRVVEPGAPRAVARQGRVGFTVTLLVAACLAALLLLSVVGGDRGLPLGPTATRQPDPAAYRHYLIGRELFSRRAVGIDQIRGHLSRAIAIDPDYADAHAELAITMIVYTPWSKHSVYQPAGSGSVEGAHARAREAIDTALMLNPTLARAHAAEGLLLHMQVSPDHEGAERALRRAIALDPHQVDAIGWLGNVLIAREQYPEGVAAWELAVRLDPLASAVNANLANHQAMGGDFLAAERRHLRMLERPDPALTPHRDLADLYAQTGRLAESLHATRNMVLAFYDESPARPAGLDMLALGYARLGLWDQAHRWLARQKQEWPDAYQSPLLASPVLRLEGRHREMVERYRQAAVPGGLRTSGLTPPDLVDYGALLALAGEYSDAIAVLQGADQGKATRAMQDDIDARQALAWAHLHTGGPDQAMVILDQIEGHYLRLQANGLLHRSMDRMLFAQNALLRGEPHTAVDRLQAAVDVGWLDYYAVAHDPRWRSLLEHPRLAAIMQDIEHRVAAQRAEAERVDASDGLTARLEHILLAGERRL